MQFYSGQKIVCVDDSPSIYGHSSRLIKGNVYTVLRSSSHRGVPYVTLYEVDPGEVFYIGFKARRFRPAVDRTTDISIFTRMLKPKDELVE